MFENEWFGWAYNPEAGALVYHHGAAHCFVVPVAGEVDPGELMALAAEVSDRPWGTPPVVAGLIRALATLVCSEGWPEDGEALHLDPATLEHVAAACGALDDSAVGCRGLCSECA